MNKSQVEFYTSKMDGGERPYTICLNVSSNKPVPLIVEVSPNGTDLVKAAGKVEEIVRIASELEKECVVVRPTGRGPGSVNQNYGEVDTFEVITDVVEKFSIDPDRISITGSSMGGAATWYLVSHNPDFFSAGAPFCGYCDYRLWEKPGGLAIHMYEWEEPSWKARSAVFLPENFLPTPIWIVHGEWDRAVGGGVPVELSRQMYSLLKKHGCSVKYTEVPNTGHGCRKEEVLREIIPWLLDQKKVREVDKIEFATFELRHNRAYWISIEQLESYGGHRALLKARRFKTKEIEIETENVKAFSLVPKQSGSSFDIKINGQEAGPIQLETRGLFRQNTDGNWSLKSNPMPGEKHRDCSGPIGDLFHDNTLIVSGTNGNGEESHHLALFANKVSDFYRKYNGGVNRGGILGENNVELQIISDKEISDEERIGNNLILLGIHSTNAVLERYRSPLSLEFRNDSIAINGKIFEGERIAVFAVFPHPENNDRCVAVHGGITADAITWGNLFNLNLMPDYIIYNGDQVLDWGFWDNNWNFD